MNDVELFVHCAGWALVILVGWTQWGKSWKA